MFRRFLVILIRRSFLVLLLICMGCVAQSSSPDLERKIERQVRSVYSIPPEIHILVSAPAPSSEWPGYDSVSVTIGNDDGKKQDLQFLVSKDRTSMMRLVKFDLTKDPYNELMKKIDVTGRPTRGAKASKVLAVKLQSCVKAQDEGAVKASMKQGDAIGVSATPTLFINGEKIDGAVPISEVRAALDRALRDNGLPVPVHAATASAPVSK